MLLLALVAARLVDFQRLLLGLGGLIGSNHLLALAPMALIALFVNALALLTVFALLASLTFLRLYSLHANFFLFGYAFREIHGLNL
jgi:hypothetical protein